LVAAALAAGCGNEDITLYGTPDETPQTIALSAAAGADGTSATLTWTSPNANWSYRVDRGGKAVATIGGTSWVDTGLAANARTCWKVYGLSGFGWQARSNEACLGTDSGGTKDWRVETQATGARWPAIASDASGGVHLCFTATGGLGVSYLRVGASGPELIDAAGASQCSLAVDAQGVVHVAFGSRAGVRHARREAGAWTVVTVDPAGAVGGTRTEGPALALAASGPRIAYRTTAAIALARRTDAGWSIESTGLPGRLGPRSLAVDAAAKDRLATLDASGAALAVWRRDAAGWVRETTFALAPANGEGAPIATPGTDAFGVTAWWQRDPPATAGAATVRWLEQDATGWTAQTVATLDRAGSRVALSVVGGTRRVLAIDADGTLRLWTRPPSVATWTEETLSAQAGAAAMVDLVVAADGQLRIAFDRSATGEVVLASRAP
jgi:hypothetical protein